MTPPPPPSSTPLTFFTANGGDVILRAGLEADLKHDFRVHKVILSLASPIFEDMFDLPQPPNQTLNEQHLPVVDILESPEVIDTILRLIYPGVEPPKIADIPTLTALLSAADKYNIMSIYPILRDALKTFLHDDPFRAYIVACRFGFLEEAKEAAKFGTVRYATCVDLEEARHISSIDVLRWAQFVQERQDKGRFCIWSTLDQAQLGEWNSSGCEHGEYGKDFYSCLGKAVKEAFALNPCVGSKDLFAVLDKVPDPPTGCAPLPDSADFYRGSGGDPFVCPLQPMTIRNHLIGIAEDLDVLNRTLLDKIFGKGLGSS